MAVLHTVLRAEKDGFTVLYGRKTSVMENSALPFRKVVRCFERIFQKILQNKKKCLPL